MLTVDVLVAEAELVLFLSSQPPKNSSAAVRATTQQVMHFIVLLQRKMGEVEMPEFWHRHWKRTGLQKQMYVENDRLAKKKPPTNRSGALRYEKDLSCLGTNLRARTPEADHGQEVVDIDGAAAVHVSRAAC